jgi:hypothetical protein
MLMASASSARTGRSLSTGVRPRSSKTGWVLTQLVTQLLLGVVSSGPAFWMQTTSTALLPGDGYHL